ncbi:MAG: cytidylate kinase family protein [Patescibacteria group bacterium]|nr:cytidylate kinase family protein [Patescibacteria group bacterium]
MGTYIKSLKKFEKPSKKRGLTITVAGLSGAGKSTVAEIIASSFRLKIFNAGDIERKFAKKKKISLLQATIIRPKRLDYEMDKTLIRLAIKGNYVLVGRLSGWVAGDWADCRIYVQCQKKIRAKRMAKRDHLTFREALRKITQRDRGDQKRYWQLYKINLKEKKIYHLFINNTQPTLRELKKQVLKKLKNFLEEKYENKNRRNKTRFFSKSASKN